MNGFIRSNSSILLPVFGAGAAFVLNLFLKSSLSASSYGDFAALLLVVSSLFMIGALGFDDVLIRLLELDEGRVLVRYSIVIAGVAVILAAPMVSYILLSMVGAVQQFDIFFLCCSLFVPASMLMGTLFKVKGQISSFYLMNSLWKVILLSFVFLFFVLDFYVEYSILIVVSIVLGFVLAVFFARHDDVVFSAGGYGVWRTMTYMLASFVSIVGYAFFDLADRFVIKELFASAEFGDYYFVFTFILSPVGIVAYYYSTKQLSAYKLKFDLVRFRADFFWVLSLSLFVAACFSSSIYFAVMLGFVSFVVDYKLLLLVVVVLAVIRGGYSIVSMAFSVVCSSGSLMAVGAGFCVVTAMAYYLMVKVLDVESFIYCVVVFPVLWFGRLLVYWFLIKLELKGGFCKV